MSSPESEPFAGISISLTPKPCDPESLARELLDKADQAQVAVLKQLLRRVEARVEELTIQLNHARQHSVAARCAHTSDVHQLNDLRERLHTANNAYQIVAKEREDLRKANAELKADLEGQRLRHEVELEEQRRCYEGLQEALDNTSDDLRHMQESYRGLEAKVASQTKDQLEGLHELKRLNELNSSWQRTYDRLKTEAEALRTANNQMEAQHAALVQANSNLVAEVQAFHQLCARTQNEQEWYAMMLRRIADVHGLTIVRDAEKWIADQEAQGKTPSQLEKDVLDQVAVVGRETQLQSKLSYANEQIAELRKALSAKEQELRDMGDAYTEATNGREHNARLVTQLQRSETPAQSHGAIMSKLAEAHDKVKQLEAELVWYKDKLQALRALITEPS